ncbi:MAG: hypothetical protein JOZ86_02825 [Candidatus Eremiobacteraeota bacterium]|nr:hypothetical protein [Candidatus Eremiobacteraeota bacterium]
MTRSFLPAAALAVALAVPAGAFAQTTAAPASPAPAAPVGHHHHDNRMKAALAQLGLSGQQQSQVDQILAQAKATRAADRNADPATKRADAQKIRAQIDAVLTPAQRAQLQSMMRAHRHVNPGGPMVPAPSPSPNT